ncbi:hypothetical protein [Streptomyces sp. NPDC059466]|uniref:hypothetical protein n=1 Tax=unclassified Streptomyces TaxID=2593676 RepID=UPI0036CCB005
MPPSWRPAYGLRQGGTGRRKGDVNGARFQPSRGFALSVRVVFPNLIQELTMADLAFVVTTIAVFALVALVAKGVTKL